MAKELAPERKELYVSLLPKLTELLNEQSRKRLPGADPVAISSRVIGDRLQLPGRSIESRKRRVRELVNVALEEGVQVVANGFGYYQPISAADFIEYEKFLKRSGLGHLKKASELKHSQAAADAQGQSALFVTSPARPEGRMI